MQYQTVQDSTKTLTAFQDDGHIIHDRMQYYCTHILPLGNSLMVAGTGGDIAGEYCGTGLTGPSE